MRRAAEFRLCGATAFNALFAQGRRLEGRYVQLIALQAAGSPGRLGLVIGRHVLPRAVDRNRLRRRLREAIRAARPAIERYDVILRTRKPVARDEIDIAAEEGAALVQRLLES